MSSKSGFRIDLSALPCSLPLWSLSLRRSFCLSRCEASRIESTATHTNTHFLSVYLSLSPSSETPVFLCTRAAAILWVFTSLGVDEFIRRNGNAARCNLLRNNVGPVRFVCLRAERGKFFKRPRLLSCADTLLVNGCSYDFRRIQWTERETIFCLDGR